MRRHLRSEFRHLRFPIGDKKPSVLTSEIHRLPRAIHRLLFASGYPIIFESRIDGRIFCHEISTEILRIQFLRNIPVKFAIVRVSG